MRGILDVFSIAMFYNDKDLHSRKNTENHYIIDALA